MEATRYRCRWGGGVSLYPSCRDMGRTAVAFPCLPKFVVVRGFATAKSETSRDYLDMPASDWFALGMIRIIFVKISFEVAGLANDAIGPPRVDYLYSFIEMWYMDTRNHGKASVLLARGLETVVCTFTVLDELIGIGIVLDAYAMPTP